MNLVFLINGPLKMENWDKTMLYLIVIKTDQLPHMALRAEEKLAEGGG
jgi:hypothetical protein